MYHSFNISINCRSRLYTQYSIAVPVCALQYGLWSDRYGHDWWQAMHDNQNACWFNGYKNRSITVTHFMCQRCGIAIGVHFSVLSWYFSVIICIYISVQNKSNKKRSRSRNTVFWIANTKLAYIINPKRSRFIDYIIGLVVSRFIS